MTKEQNEDKILALLRERAGLVTRGLADRVKEVDAELRRLGAKGEAPAQRSTKRVTKADAKR